MGTTKFPAKPKQEKRAIFSVSFIVAVFLLFPCLIFGQTPASTRLATKPSPKDWQVINLAATGFPNSLPVELIPALQAYLKLTETQIDQVKKLRELYDRKFFAAKAADHLQMIAETSNGKIPRDPDKESAAWRAYDVIFEECVLETEKLKKILGEKFDDFELWLNQQVTIDIEISNRRRRGAELDGEKIAIEVYEKIKKWDLYKKISDREKKKSRAIFDGYLSKCEKNFRLRVLYEASNYGFSISPMKTKKEIRREVQEKRKAILEELKRNGQD